MHARTESQPRNAGRTRLSVDAHRTPEDGEPIWPLADIMFPRQGSWTASAYLNLATNRIVEFVDGRLEFPPIPTRLHQLILRYLFRLLDQIVSEARVGEVLFAAHPVEVARGKFREPDLMFIPNGANEGRDSAEVDQFAVGITLAIEMVSPSDPKRDYETKRIEYAAAGIREYWIVDPDKEAITVLTLDGDTYREAGVYTGDAVAHSILIPDFAPTAKAVFDAGRKA